MDVSLADISAVIRLVRETCDHWDDPAAWRQHLLRGACTLLNGHAALMVADHAARKRGFGRITVTASFGIPSPVRAIAQPAVARLDRLDVDDASALVLPGMTRLYQQVERQGWATASRTDLCADDAVYHAAPFYTDFRARYDADDYVVSVRLCDVPRRPEGINVDRPRGAAPFGAREVALLKLLHDEIAPLVGVRLATEEHLSRDGLSRRLRQTLSLLLQGLGEKQVARELGLSPKTVHEYVTTLYQHFEVSSRAELLAYFIRRQPTPRTQFTAPRASRPRP